MLIVILINGSMVYLCLQQDDLTTDRTISPTDQNGGFDYMEDIIKP